LHRLNSIDCCEWWASNDMDGDSDLRKGTILAFTEEIKKKT